MFAIIHPLICDNRKYFEYLFETKNPFMLITPSKEGQSQQI
jgi:hypothetical protein